ncbi:MAG TPA: glycoside hydrolase family 2 TIM barrel-domain containing protein [Methylophilaceae bacterium]|nr:glycoside hydrolase family 2 TIM barrel-domain containing protein [Methylophilaceae bacterium]
MRFCILSILVLLSMTNHAHAEVQDLGGSWQFQPTTEAKVSPDSAPSAESSWQTIQVPDNWFRQGHDISGKAWYRKQISVKPEMLKRHVRLVFEGVDYMADVWINGHYLGHHEGYFQSFDFDISKHLQQGDNVLTVLVDSPLEEPKAWSFNKRLLKGIFSHHDTRPGGAWSERGQEQNTGGIWAPVRLEISDQLAIRQLALKPKLISPKITQNSWNLEADALLDSDLANDAEVSVEAVLVPENFKGKSYNLRQKNQLKNGEGKLAFTMPVEQPVLWWPAGHGKPNLYRLKLNILKAGRVLDHKEAVIGFREVRVDSSTQQWYVNGRRLFLRGTNYIASQWLAEMTPARYAQDMELMQQANINAIRVHAHIEAPGFYELCDRSGILVMQDFLLQWGYSDDQDFTREARKQAADMVNSLSNHPTVVAWVLHNEPPWDAPWMHTKYPDYLPDKNRTLDDLLFADISALDPSRVVRKESPVREHEWIGWYFGQWQDFAKPAKNPWITEFGAQALPNLTSLKKIFKDDELWPDNQQKWEKWHFHNFQPHETFDIARVPMGDNIEAFIANTQAYQAKLTQFAAESYRRQRYQPVSAIFQFMFVEDWPSINWGVLDYWRQPKPGYAALKTAYQPVLPSIEWIRESYTEGETATLGLWVINDLWQGYPKARYQVVVSLEGKQIRDKMLAVDIAEDSGIKLEDLKLENLIAGSYQVKVKILSAGGKLLGENQHQFSVLKK